VIVALLLLLGWLSKIFSRRNDGRRERLVAIPSLVTPREEPESEPESSSPVVVSQPQAESVLLLGASSSSESGEDCDESSGSSESRGSSGSLSVHLVEIGGDSPQVYRTGLKSSLWRCLAWILCLIVLDSNACCSQILVGGRERGKEGRGCVRRVSQSVSELNQSLSAECGLLWVEHNQHLAVKVSTEEAAVSPVSQSVDRRRETR
jgi:hypothetical protein